MTKYETSDLVGFALDQKPDEFKAAFNDVIADRIAHALEVKKQEVATNYFNSSEETEQENNTEEENGQDTQTNA